MTGPGDASPCEREQNTGRDASGGSPAGGQPSEWTNRKLYANPWGAAAVVGLLFVYVLVAVRSAWICDDAYITLRTVDNFIHGFGLTWNAGERVQSYSHPLWMMILSAVYSLTREPYYGSILLGLIVSAATAAVFVFCIARSCIEAALGLTLLILSKAFNDYSTSGLENPATHLLLALYFWILLRSRPGEIPIIRLALVASFAALNRLDAIVLYAPSLLLCLIQGKSWRNVGAAALGFVPLFVWEAFSLIYYGFLFPNSAYAKLGTGWPAFELFRQGLHYFAFSERLDPITLIVVAAGVIAGFAGRDSRKISLASGILLYLFYVTRIGGDFMAGRFLTAPFLVSVILFSEWVARMPRLAVGAAFAAAMAVGFASPFSPLFSGADYRLAESPSDCFDSAHVSDERGFYYRDTGLLRVLSGKASVKNMGWSLVGHAGAVNKADVIVFGNSGFCGFESGPEVYVVDPLALSDALLARLPAQRDKEFQSGHFPRTIPRGYIQSLVLGKNLISDPAIADAHEKVDLITRGELFSARRWRAIFDLNLRKGVRPGDPESYTHPNESYFNPAVYNIRIEGSNDPGREILEWSAPSGLLLIPNQPGASFFVEGLSRASILELRLETSFAYLVTYMKGQQIEGNSPIRLPPGSGGVGSQSDIKLEVPPGARAEGFDSVWISLEDEKTRPGKLFRIRLSTDGAGHPTS